MTYNAFPSKNNNQCYFSQDKQEIGLASKDEAIFFHELSHAAHTRLVGDLRTVPPWEKEVVAELAAAALCRIVGKEAQYLGSSFQYIRHFANQEGLSPVKACLKVINQTEAVLTAILGPLPSSSTGQYEQVFPYVFAEGAEATAPAQAAL